EAVERIEVGMLAAGMPIVCEPAEAKRRPASVVEAQFSLPFGVAVALARGTASPAVFAPDVFTDPAVRRLMDRVVAIPDATLDARYPRAWPCWVRVVVHGRSPLEARVDHPRGDPENFPPDAELDGKFRVLAARALPAATIDRLAGALAAFPRAASARTLLAATVPTVT